MVYFYRLQGMVCPSVWLSVYLSVGHNRVPCKNGWADQDAIWDVDLYAWVYIFNVYIISTFVNVKWTKTLVEKMHTLWSVDSQEN